MFDYQRVHHTKSVEIPSILPRLMTLEGISPVLDPSLPIGSMYAIHGNMDPIDIPKC